MEVYKEINKELIKQVQDLRSQNNALQKEIIMLRNELMDERTKHVVRENNLKYMLIENFRRTMCALDPDSDMFEILKRFYGDVDDECCIGYKAVVNSQPAKLSNSQIFSKLRRSNSLQPRNSKVASPIKRSSSDMSIVSDMSSPPVENNNLENTGSDINLTPCNKSDSLDHIETSNDNQTSKSASSIEFDEKVDENKEVTEIYRNIQKLSYISEEEMQSNILEGSTSMESLILGSFRQPDPLPLLNFEKDEVNEPQLNIPLSDISNRISKEHGEKTNYKSKSQVSCNVTQRVRRRSYKCGSDSISDNSIEQVRNMASYKGKNQISTEVNNAKEQTTLDIGTINTFNELSLSRCSTPNNLEDVQETLDDNSSRRNLRRNCKPKCLVEKSLREKLRNETKISFKKRSKTRKR